MNIIYLHGFQSHANSVKGRLLQQYCQTYRPEICVHLPDLNASPDVVISQLHHYIKQLKNIAFVGSSLGGFYATYLACEYNVPAVLVNPTVAPWQIFQQKFKNVSLPCKITSTWSLDVTDLAQLQQLGQNIHLDFRQFLVLLQKGDDVLNYEEAERYYTKMPYPSMVITEENGNHVMDNFEEKIPMLLTFLSCRLRRK